MLGVKSSSGDLGRWPPDRLFHTYPACRAWTCPAPPLLGRRADSGRRRWPTTCPIPRRVGRAVGWPGSARRAARASKGRLRTRRGRLRLEGQAAASQASRLAMASQAASASARRTAGRGGWCSVLMVSVLQLTTKKPRPPWPSSAVVGALTLVALLGIRGEIGGSQYRGNLIQIVSRIIPLSMENGPAVNGSEERIEWMDGMQSV